MCRTQRCSRGVKGREVDRRWQRSKPGPKAKRLNQAKVKLTHLPGPQAKPRSVLAVVVTRQPWSRTRTLCMSPLGSPLKNHQQINDHSHFEPGFSSQYMDVVIMIKVFP